jgi:succinate-acetate transporter protein
MATMEERRAGALAGTDGDTNGWATRVVLQPIAAPSVLGLAGFSVSTMMVATIQAKWWGGPVDFPAIAPFCLAFGGLAQLLAGMWAYKARDVVATLAHGTWGAFWIAFFVLQMLEVTKTIPTPAPDAKDLAFGMWMIGLAYVTWTATAGAMAENLGIAAVLGTLALGSSFSAIGFLTGGFESGWSTLGGWLFVISAGLAWYALTAMTLMSVTGRAILPTGELSKKANKPGSPTVYPIQLDWAEPGVKQGQ